MLAIIKIDRKFNKKSFGRAHAYCFVIPFLNMATKTLLPVDKTWVTNSVNLFML